ncbi:MAG: FeoA domain-containing protein [Vicinamibacterales bacterium]
MTDPLISLVLVLVAVGATAALLWPGTGLAWRWRRGLVASDRVEVEDALKHIWDGEYRQRPATLESLAGALGLTGRAAAELVDRLGRLALVVHDEASLRLTPDGRREALRVIRIHRLWERYLADETGLDAREWHAHAERREHGTTAAQAEALAATLGHPRYDPHGDPIPMPSGELPPHQGVPLTQLQPDQAAEIVHLEDEPDAVFAQIVAAGLTPGMRVRLIERTPQRLRFEAEADEVVLAPVVAANVTVLPIERPHDGPAGPSGATMRLSAIAPGESADVVALAAGCRGAQRRRLLDLGVVPGTRVTSELRGPSGDPTAYRIRGALIALRRDQAHHILVTRVQEAA